MLNKIETHTAYIYKDGEGIVHVDIRDGAVIDYYDALDQYLVIKNFSEEGPVLKLIDGRCSWSIQKRARKFLAGKEVKEKTIARAVVVNSVLRKLFANFFNEMNKREVPTRVFTEYEEAYAWLLAKKEKP